MSNEKLLTFVLDPMVIWWLCAYLCIVMIGPVNKTEFHLLLVYYQDLLTSVC